MFYKTIRKLGIILNEKKWLRQNKIKLYWQTHLAIIVFNQEILWILKL